MSTDVGPTAECLLGIDQNRHLSRNQDGTNNSCQPKRCPNAPLVIKKVLYAYRIYKISRSRSGQIRPKNENVVRVSCDQCLRRDLGRIMQANFLIHDFLFIYFLLMFSVRTSKKILTFDNKKYQKMRFKK